MNKIFLVLASLAFLSAHVARGAKDDSGPAIGKTCTSDRGTFQSGERYCASDSTSRVCAYGEWYDFQCDAGSTCLENKDLKQVLCRKIQKNVDNGQNGAGQNNQIRRARRDVPPTDRTCNSGRGTFRHGERYCASSTTSRVCAYGEWTDQQCDPQSECLESSTVKDVLCRRIVKNTRKRRDANDTDSEDKPCTSDRGTFQNGDRYCASETTHRVCSFGQWIDNDCPAEFKCKENKELKQVLCRKVNKNAPWPTGPSGSDNTEPQPKQQPPPAQPDDRPQAQPSSSSQTEPKAQPKPEAPAQPQAAPETPVPAAPAQPQANPAPVAPAQPQANPAPVAPAPTQDAEEKLCPGGLKEGEQICSGETGYKRCSSGQLIEDQCDASAKCVASKDTKAVICRAIVRNANNQQQNQQQQRR